MLKDIRGKELKEGDVVLSAFRIKRIHTKDEYSSMDLESIELRKPDHEPERIALSSSVCKFEMSSAEFEEELELKKVVEDQERERAAAQAEMAKELERQALKAQLRAEVEAEMRAEQAAGKTKPPVDDDIVGGKPEEKPDNKKK